MKHRADHDRVVSRRAFLGSAGLAVVTVASGLSQLTACGRSDSQRPPAAAPAEGTAVSLFRQEGCSCCATYADYLRDNGFTVDMNTLDDLEPIRRRHGIPEAAVGCHTSVVDGYVVEGHVPAEAIERLLTERPQVDGITVVGMPANSPGMGDPNGQPLQVLSFRGGRIAEFMSVTMF